MLKYVEICWNMLKCVEMCKNMLKYVEICWNMFNCLELLSKNYIGRRLYQYKEDYFLCKL